eukprot:16281-Heterococcus_DN1.PRE.1
MVSSMLKVAQQQQQHQPVMTQAPPQCANDYCFSKFFVCRICCRKSLVSKVEQDQLHSDTEPSSAALSSCFLFTLPLYAQLATTLISFPFCLQCLLTCDHQIANESASVPAAASGIGGSALARSDSSTEAAAAAATDADSSSSSKQKKQKVKQPCANANCGQLTTKRCRRCTVVHYCSVECQKICFKDPQHRAQCIELASAIV